jgi:hypothetical protein
MPPNARLGSRSTSAYRIMMLQTYAAKSRVGLQQHLFRDWNGNFEVSHVFERKKLAMPKKKFKFKKPKTESRSC